MAITSCVTLFTNRQIRNLTERYGTDTSSIVRVSLLHRVVWEIKAFLKVVNVSRHPEGFSSPTQLKIRTDVRKVDALTGGKAI